MLEQIQQLDGQLLITIQGLLIHDVLTPFVTEFTRLGNSGKMWIVISVVLLLFKKTRKMGITAILALALMHVSVNIIIKPIVARTRPYEIFGAVQLLIAKQHDYSFPSGHTAAAFAAAYSYYMMAEKKQIKFAALGFVGAILMGLSRLYVGVHYPGDVVCGALWGMLCGWVACKIMDSITSRKSSVAGR